MPPLGNKKVDAINNEDVQRVKRNLRDKAPKTVNNVLSVLNTLLKVAVAWEVIEGMPCTIKLLPVPRTNASFHDFERHTFCSHLAMRGAPAKAIQELAGHADLGTTQRYMHLSPAAVESAIWLLEEPIPVPAFGDIVETGST